jgi:hypothetical protein
MNNADRQIGATRAIIRIVLVTPAVFWTPGLIVVCWHFPDHLAQRNWGSLFITALAPAYIVGLAALCTSVCTTGPLDLCVPKLRALIKFGSCAWLIIAATIVAATFVEGRESLDFRDWVWWSWISGPVTLSIWNLYALRRRANQALQHNDPGCHESCLRTPRASRGRG